jgi:hypothetical protein
MFHPDSTDTASIPSDTDTLLDDECFDPVADDYLDRCLFEMRQSLADFRNA